jgi:hypothetical protein
MKRKYGVETASKRFVVRKRGNKVDTLGEGLGKELVAEEKFIRDRRWRSFREK